MANREYVQGIFDSGSSILTIGTSKAYKVKGIISDLDSGTRMERLTAWARSQSLIGNNGVIAEI